MAAQPEFVAAARDGVEQARRAQTADGAGNSSHTSVRSWGRFTTYGLRLSMVRSAVTPDSPWHDRMCELDIVEAWAWWLVTQVGVSVETAKDYLYVANSWHDRFVGFGLGAGLPLLRVTRMLDGLARLRGVPPPRRMRIGVRPRHLRQAIDGALDVTRPLDANYAAAFETAEAALARGCEVASGLAHGVFNPNRHPTRDDVTFECDAQGLPTSATIKIVNSKARGVEALRKLPVTLPMRGRFLSPGLALWRLVHVIDPVPPAQRGTTPLFRDPATNRVITVDSLRSTLRAALSYIGRDGTLYGAHSLRIGGATAMAFVQASAQVIKDCGRWRSDAYLRYIRERRGEYMTYMQEMCSADVDDFEADHLDVDGGELDETDYE